MKVIVQNIKNVSNTNFILAEKYYNILSAINGLKLTQREVQLVAFTAIKGNLSYADYRNEFCTLHNTTNPTINNIISRLKKIGVLIKKEGKVKVNSIINIDFTADITLEIKLIHG